MYNLGRDSGFGDRECFSLFDYTSDVCFPELSPEQKLQLLQVTSNTNSYERCIALTKNLPQPDYDSIARCIVRDRMEALLKQAQKRIELAFGRFMTETHKGIPTPITPKMLKLFRDEHPKIDTADVKLSPQGLGLNFCNFHTCKFFLRPMDTLVPTTTMSPDLRKHMQSLSIIPCMHKAVVAAQAQQGKLVSATVAKEIMSGQHLESFGDPSSVENSDRLNKTLELAKQNLDKSTGGDEEWLPRMLDRIKKSYDGDETHYRKHVEPALLRRYAAVQDPVTACPPR